MTGINLKKWLGQSLLREEVGCSDHSCKRKVMYVWNPEKEGSLGTY
jgi:hypothetical protein